MCVLINQNTKSEYQNTKKIYGKGYIPNWSEKTFVTKEIKNTVPWTLMIYMVKKLLKHFMKKNCKR